MAQKYSSVSQKPDENLSDWEFQIQLCDFGAYNLTTRHRFKEKLRLQMQLDRLKFKTEYTQVGGRPLSWRFNQETLLKIPKTGQTLKDLCDYLKKNHFHVICYCQHASKEKRNLGVPKCDSAGECSVSLYTAATGPAHHDLSLHDSTGKSVGKLRFTFYFEQVTPIAVLIKEIKCHNLVSTSDTYSCNPFLKYYYSKYHQLIQQGKAKALFSYVQHDCLSPEWKNLPVLRLKATLRELVNESIVMHVLHQAKNHKQYSLGRCALQFRVLGLTKRKKSMDGVLIGFKGKLSGSSATVDGILTTAFLPHFSHMKNAIGQKALHTDDGIHNAQAFLPWVCPPDVQVKRRRRGTDMGHAVDLEEAESASEVETGGRSHRRRNSFSEVEKTGEYQSDKDLVVFTDTETEFDPRGEKKDGIEEEQPSQDAPSPPSFRENFADLQDKQFQVAPSPPTSRADFSASFSEIKKAPTSAFNPFADSPIPPATPNYPPHLRKANTPNFFDPFEDDFLL